MKRYVFLTFMLIISLSLGARKLRPLVWVLDAGHGGHDQGTNAENVLEKDVNLQIVQQLASLLHRYKPGISVILTRDDDRYLSLDERCQIANRANADLFLSVHVNYALSNPFLTGTETFYANIRAAKDAVRAGSLSRTAEKSELLAWLIQKNYRDGGRPSSRGAKSYDYYVVQNTDMPAALTEVGFISNHEECLLLQSKNGQKEIATMLYNALMEYYTTTQAQTHTQTLQRLRTTAGLQSGVTVDKLPVSQASQPVPQPVAQEAAQPVIHQVVQQEVNPQIGEVIAVYEPTNTNVAESQVVETIEQETTPEPVATEVTEKPVLQAAPVKLQEKEEIIPTPSIPVFAVQVFAVSSQIKADDARLKGLTPVRLVASGNMFKVLYGESTDVKQARATLNKVKEQFPDAFLVAYLDDKPITIAEAMQLLNP